MMSTLLVSGRETRTRGLLKAGNSCLFPVYCERRGLTAGSLRSSLTPFYG